ncbi:MAG: 4'-phosphopantetheinyl transferase superfamily protein [bacterium]
MGEGADWLTGPEQEVLEGLDFPKRREEWLLGRWTAKGAVAAYLRMKGGGIQPSEIEIRAAGDGAPEAYHRGEPLPVRLSLSHREGVGLSVVTGPDISPGCDVEHIEPRSGAFVRDYLNLPEREALRSAPEGRRDLLANLYWSAKESALKVLRQGLRQDPLQWAVLPRGLEGGSPGTWKHLTVEGQGGLAFQGWWRWAEGKVLTFLSDPAVPQPDPLPEEERKDRS